MGGAPCGISWKIDKCEVENHKITTSKAISKVCYVQDENKQDLSYQDIVIGAQEVPLPSKEKGNVLILYLCC